MIPENPKPRSTMVLRSDALAVQGLRLTNMFRMLQDAAGRERVIASAERLSNARNAKPKSAQSFVFAVPRCRKR
jgi:hypothetical protein